MLEELFIKGRELAEAAERNRPAIEQQIAALDSEKSRALLGCENDPAMNRAMGLWLTQWAQHGWFPSCWTTPLALIGSAAKALGTKDHEEAEAAIQKYFENGAESFIEGVKKHHPSRAGILVDAFTAHSRGLFSLSIPTFLIQADGIAASFFGIDSIYTVSAKNYESIRQKLGEPKRQGSFQYFTFLISILTPLSATRSKRQQYGPALNRHAVIHGESTNYASLLNSLKSISWLNFVCEVTSRTFIRTTLPISPP